MKTKKDRIEIVQDDEKSKKSKKRAFTLIELLSVIIILSVFVIIAIPAVSNYVSNSRKSAYVVTAQSVVDGARNVVNEGKIPVYDTDATFYIPASFIKTENDLKSPYGEFVEAYVAVTYDNDGFNYYWTSNDKSNTGIYLTYYDKLNVDTIRTSVSSIGTDIGICGKNKIVVFDQYGQVMETKSSDADCVEPMGSYDFEDLTTCPDRLITQFGSFSTSSDEKQTCVSLDYDYSYSYEYTSVLFGSNSNNLNPILVVRLRKESFNSGSYIRVYKDNTMTELVEEITLADYPKYSYVISSPYKDYSAQIMRTLPDNGGARYYIDMSNDIRSIIEENYSVEISYGRTSTNYENGPWIKKRKDYSKIENLMNSLYDIDLTTVCTNSNPRGGLQLSGFHEVENAYMAEIQVYCNGIPK